MGRSSLFSRFYSPILAMSALALRSWSTLLAVFEIPMIVETLSGKKNDDFKGRMSDCEFSRRLWSVFVAYLAFARLSHAVSPNSVTAAVHNAALHILEAFFLVPESQFMGRDGPKALASVIIFNAGLYFVAAMNALKKRKQMVKALA